MTSEQTSRLVDAMEQEAEELRERMEARAGKPIIHSEDVITVAARTVGKLEGWADAIRESRSFNS